MITKVKKIHCCLCGTEIKSPRGEKYVWELGYNPHPSEPEIQFHLTSFHFKRCCKDCYEHIVIPDMEKLDC